MTKSHGRKSRARTKSRARGAAFASANAGTLHQHTSGPSAADLQPVDPKRWGVDTAPDMRTASALISACIDRCGPCQHSLAGVHILDCHLQRPQDLLAERQEEFNALCRAWREHHQP